MYEVEEVRKDEGESREVGGGVKDEKESERVEGGGKRGEV